MMSMMARFVPRHEQNMVLTKAALPMRPFLLPLRLATAAGDVTALSVATSATVKCLRTNI